MCSQPAGRTATQPVRGSPLQRGPGSGRSLAIDLVKAIAMVGVIAQHSLPNLRAVGASFWIFQAVPVLVVLFGMNMKGSLDRSVRAGLPWYVQSYLPRRLERLLIPFAVVWVVAYALARWSGTAHVGGLALAGALPVPAPGNYFVPMILALTLAVPPVHAAYRRWATGTVLALAALDLGFELVAPRIPVLMGHGQFLYDASPFRYLVAFVAGFLLVDRASSGAARAAGAVLVAASFAYLVLELTHGEWFDALVPGFTRPTNLAAVPYCAALTLLLLRALPGTSSNPALRAAGYVGRASFHVFLVQMVWFAFHPGHDTGPFLVALAVCFPLGVAFFWLEDRMIRRLHPSPTEAVPRLVARREPTEPSSSGDADSRTRSRHAKH
jgi:Acyltransferase family